MRHPFELELSELETLNLEFQQITAEEAGKLYGGSVVTTEALGEEGGVTTEAMREVGGVTTQALCEEGGWGF